MQTLVKISSHYKYYALLTICPLRLEWHNCSWPGIIKKISKIEGHLASLDLKLFGDTIPPQGNWVTPNIKNKVRKISLHYFHHLCFTLGFSFLSSIKISSGRSHFLPLFLNRQIYSYQKLFLTSKFTWYHKSFYENQV